MTAYEAAKLGWEVTAQQARHKAGHIIERDNNGNIIFTKMTVKNDDLVPAKPKKLRVRTIADAIAKVSV